MSRIYLALGSNLGNRMATLQDAVARLAPAVQVTDISSVYETEPWGVTDQPRFLNMAVGGETDLEPSALLQFVKGIERALGRGETVRYGPRVIDIDILLYDDRIVQADNLEIPHPRLSERRFVLVPLAEIAPDVVHPVLQRTIQECADALPDEGQARQFGTLDQSN